MKKTILYEDAEEIVVQMLEQGILYATVDELIESFSHNMDAWIRNIFINKKLALTKEEKEKFKKVAGKVLFERDLETILF